jgi:hypothetical protein
MVLIFFLKPSKMLYNTHKFIMHDRRSHCNELHTMSYFFSILYRIGTSYSYHPTCLYFYYYHILINRRYLTRRNNTLFFSINYILCRVSSKILRQNPLVLRGIFKEKKGLFLNLTKIFSF